MGRIFVTSDLHFGHDRQFLYGPRGFNSIQEHDETVIKNWNEIVRPDDTVWVLGDLMLGDNAHGMSCLNQLNGTLNVCLGNHDTDSRKFLYENTAWKIASVQYATVIKYGKYHFYLSHYPTMTANLEKEHLTQCLINLFGHTHSNKKFYNDIPFMYNVALDANENKPVLLDDIIESCKAEVKKCFDLL